MKINKVKELHKEQKYKKKINDRMIILSKNNNLGF